MRAIASVAIAAALAATSLTTTVTPADAGGKHWKQPYYGKQYYGKRHYGKRYNRGWNPGAALATGAILGLTFGALAAQPNYYHAPRVYAYPPPPPPPPYPVYSYSYGMSPQHVSYCYSKYRSYNVKYNTWIGFDGLVHQCVSPY